MPIYEYRCEKCRHELETIQKLSDPPLRKCPACGRQALKKKVSAAAFRLKGGGWYETDFKSDKQRNVAAADSATDGGGTSDGSSSDGDAAARQNAAGGEAKSGEAKSGDTKSGDTKSDTKSGDTKSRDAKPNRKSKGARPESSGGSAKSS